MSSILYRVGRFSFRHKWWVLVGWLAALVVVAGSVSALQPKFSQDFDLPGTDGGIAMEQMQEYFPQLSSQMEKPTTTVVVQADDGLAKHAEAIDALVGDLKKLDKAEPDTIVSPLAVAAAQPQLAATVIGDDGRVGLISVSQSVNMMDVDVELKNQLVDTLAEHRGDGLNVEAMGGVMSSMEPAGKAELIGFAIAFVVMIIAFGALVAAFIPLVTGLVGVGLTMMLVTLSAEVLSINQAATAIITMLGIAVCIDYSLFVVSRYRSEVNRGGAREDAAGRAVGTAGSAVVFAGLTVIIAVAALMVIGIPIITQMGLGAAVAILVAVCAALTFIPALLGAFGRFAFTPRIPWIKHAEEHPTADSLGVKFGRQLVKRPIPFVVAALAILIAAAIPMKGMQLGMDTTTDDQVAAQKLISKGFGEGVGGQLMVVLHTEEGTIDDAANTAVAEIQAMPGVESPQTLRWMGNGADLQNPNANANSAMITVTPISSPSSEETHDLVEKIRATSDAIGEKGAEIHVGGQTAILSDLSAKLDKALIPYLIVVVGLAFLIMIGVFRSILVPLIGTLGFIFSMIATFGITTAIFTDGAFGLIDHTKPLISFLPIFLIGVVFGLAMDYQVFLVTRMREEFMHGMSAKDAIVAGYRHGSRVVVSAAIIMISVFAAFMLSPDTTAKMMGFALAIAVFFDAFLVRMIIVPGVLAMLGERAWGLPQWLDKLVINFDIEGEKVRNRGLPAEGSSTLENPEPTPTGAA
ncbi:MMPL family transporter [Gordonia hydrophobica]|uniref:MMPL family transporter n=1 Tax=Gordonia hydrophobica TaxID=40516 RepID=A0ABZ2U2I4_9ACTN|nr:MMPL family transporter [Gordonia hydrophobica]MBM7369033.1 RND superfamily putative drug exporter [Gordonia hydrophobica]